MTDLKIVILCVAAISIFFDNGDSIICCSPKQVDCSFYSVRDAFGKLLLEGINEDTGSYKVYLSAQTLLDGDVDFFSTL